METYFVVTAVVAIVIFGGKIAKEFFKWLTKDIGKKR